MKLCCRTRHAMPACHDARTYATHYRALPGQTRPTMQNTRWACVAVRCNFSIIYLVEKPPSYTLTGR